MKKTRRFIAGLSALAMASVLAPMSAFAANETGTTNVSYIVTPSYTVNIPAGVTLDSDNSVTANIEASNVILESKKKIQVALTGASNTASGSNFSAKTEKGDSTATYTISKGETAVAVGDTVAEFTAAGTQALTFSKASGATHAGAHTETLTFTISVESAINNPYAANNPGSEVTFGNYQWYILDKSEDGVTLLMKTSLGNQKYHSAQGDITWENSSLRAYLNGDFYDSFSPEDKAKIALTRNTNPDNTYYGNVDGGNDTEDHIYLLSIDEFRNLYDTVLEPYGVADFRGIGTQWWLRSPGGMYSDQAAFVNSEGTLDTYGTGAYIASYGVRPVLKLHFE